MISDLPMFQVLGAMARHAAESQKVSATNIAHADEPGYKAAKIESFEAFIARAASGTEPGGVSASFKTLLADTQAAPNGNTVSLEQELFSSAEAMGQHNLALTAYTKTLDLLRTAMGKGR
ncbi:MAG: flagellar basal body rod protein FlgB [Hyphomonas sp. BRH_c22]|uniref:flagellar biosynthesis protein FlgB n=1 Tax=Hyphomonas sp. BRH_c22 TaxID=1629710 RepID=UPI0005F19545|nr:flagellar biosynthesis protein FlgB [Hyphomonas sp. BRH_c22]KJS34526.1 MAG: flagellar basal body rod protein FlgB [Hyphomonas sp. BRH_c22]